MGSCRHLYSKTISLVGMLASINNSKALPKLLDADDEIGENDLESSEEGNLDDIVQIGGGGGGDNNYSSTKPTMRRQDFFNEQIKQQTSLKSVSSSPKSVKALNDTDVT